MGWLDRYFLQDNYSTVQDEGTDLPPEPALNFVGTGVAVTDDPTNNRSVVTITAGGGSVPTGTGFFGVTAGAMDAAAIKVNLASSTYVNGVLADTNGGTGLSALGSGVATWMGTPSSANLAAAVSDETGSGALVFGTAPLFKTTINLNNPGNTFKYVLTPAAIAADRTLTLPLLAGNDTMVCEAFTQTLTNKTIASGSNTITGLANASIDAAAAIAGTKIAPDFGSQLIRTTGNILTTGYFYTGTGNIAATGNMRMQNTHSIRMRNAANSADATVCQYSAGDTMFIGLDSAYANQAFAIIMAASSSMYLGIGSTFYFQLTGGNTESSKPIIGSGTYSSPYGVHGKVTHTFAADSNYTVTAAQYKFQILHFITGSWSVGRTVTFPHPASEAVSYEKTIYNNTAYTMTVSTGTGTTQTIPTGQANRFWFSNAGVNYGGSAWTP